ncbi:flagellar export protein FliJ [Desulfobulbus alkaliphilus]|uniref:flagellar export protein FliJ n=1 Tax=Desulfobulbus alkaliphilus TaxID=869814 RepID=UPI00196562FE|nr:flagellar export protein FliJ [Desulfobulbus alkaliphilus]MBM9537432.1 flagellar export protein FliJ [Desulfobulbus alkaliphilus]
MKPFTMHAVLKYRQQLEDVARKNLHRALEQATRLEEALLRSQDELAALHKDLRRESEHGTNSDRLLLFERRIRLVQEEIIRRQKDFDKHQIMVTKKRQQLVSASKDRKVMEKLREQQNTAFRNSLARKEAAMLDEIAVLSHGRQGDSGTS